MHRLHAHQVPKSLVELYPETTMCDMHTGSSGPVRPGTQILVKIMTSEEYDTRPMQHQSGWLLQILSFPKWNSTDKG